MSNVSSLCLLLSAIAITSCSTLKTTGHVDYAPDSLLLKMSFLNNSSDTLLLPKRLVLTPKIDNTINGVFELSRYSKSSRKNLVEHRIFDIGIPFYYSLEAFNINENNGVLLAPKSTHEYTSDLTPFYEELSQGKYMLEVTLINIFGERLKKDRRVKMYFIVK